MVFKKGNHPKTEFKKGHHPKTEFKKGNKYEFKNGNKYRFKKRSTPWNKNLTKETSNKVRNMGGESGKTRKKLYKEGNLTFSEEHRKKLRGRKPWNYIDGRSRFLTTARYGDDWEAIRLLIYKRDNCTCQECGITMNDAKIPFHVHHKIPFLISFDNSLNNLTTLCPSCHRKIEAEIMRKLKTIQKTI